MPPIDNDNSDLSPDIVPTMPAQPMADVTTGPPISDPIPASVTPPPVENLPPQGQTFNPQTPPYPSVNQEPAINPQNDVVATVPSDSSQKESLTNLTSFSDQTAVPASQETQSISEKENIYTEICSQIIKEQEKIIGALAIEEADRVGGLAVDHVTYHCTVVGDGSKIIDDLIGQYRDFFGHAAVEVCKEAAAHFITKLSAEALPTSLR